jgi:transposase
VEETLEASWSDSEPGKLIGDKAYDSDKLDQKLMEERGTELIAPNRSNRQVKTQDGRPLRRYKRRWKIERINAWLQNFRRVVVRWEVKAKNYLGFVQMACLVIIGRII